MEKLKPPLCIAAIALPHCTGFCHYCSNLAKPRLLINLEKLFNVFLHLAWRKVKKIPIVIVYEKIWMKLYLNDAKLWNFIAFLIEHPMRRLPLYFVSWKNSVLWNSIIQSSYIAWEPLKDIWCVSIPLKTCGMA